MVMVVITRMMYKWGRSKECKVHKVDWLSECSGKFSLLLLKFKQSLDCMIDQLAPLAKQRMIGTYGGLNQN